MGMLTPLKWLRIDKAGGKKEDHVVEVFGTWPACGIHSPKRVATVWRRAKRILRELDNVQDRLVFFPLWTGKDTHHLRLAQVKQRFVIKFPQKMAIHLSTPTKSFGLTQRRRLA
jgi:hypothetical protein